MKGVANMAGQYNFRFLSQPFLRGTVSGQIKSLYDHRHTHPERIVEFREALAQGLVTLGETLTRQQAQKLADMQIAIPAGVRVCSPRAAKAQADA